MSYEAAIGGDYEAAWEIIRQREAAGLTRFPRAFAGDLEEVLALRKQVTGEHRSCPCEYCFYAAPIEPWFD